MIKELIYDAMLKKDDYGASGDIHPSMLNNCMRQLYYKKIKAEITNPITAASYLKMEMGNAGHNVIESIIKNIPDIQVIATENYATIIYDNLKWNYKPDSVIKLKDKTYILEIKTVYARGFDAIETDPRDEHLLQIYCYMTFENIHDAILLYTGRDNGFQIEYILHEKDGIMYYNDKEIKIKEYFDIQVNKVKALLSNITDNKIPDKEYKRVFKKVKSETDYILSEDFQKDKVKYKSEWRCLYCSYADKCWSAELEYMETHDFYLGELI
jgi:hypothetical protein